MFNDTDYERIELRLPQQTIDEATAHAKRLSISLEMFVIYALIRYMDERGYSQLAKAVTETNEPTPTK